MGVLDSLQAVPRPVLWTGAGLLVLFFFLRGRRQAAAPVDTGLSATMASMQLAAASNIEALGITSQRDVALAAEQTNRYGVAQQVMAAREGRALDFLEHRAAGKTRLSSERMEHDTVLQQGRWAYALNREDLKQQLVRTNQEFAFARVGQTQDFYLDKKYFPKMFELELERINSEREAQRQAHDIQTRRLDIMQFQGSYPQGVPGAVGSLVDSAGRAVHTGLDIYDRVSGPSAGNVAGGALSGAASGAAIGSMVPGIGTAIGAGVGAAAGGGGGAS